MNNKIGIGVVGCGNRIFGLLEQILPQSDRLEIRSLYDPSEKSVARYHERFGRDIPVYKTSAEASAAKGVDWVMIGSWNCFHAQQAIEALDAGKHVFCEKPLATTMDDCLAMNDAWQRSGKVFFVGFPMRYSVHYRTIKKLIDAGEIGDIVSLEFNETLEFNHGGYIHQDWRRFTKYAGSHLLEKCCHDIDMIEWMVGSLPRRIASFGGLDFFVPKNEFHIERIGKDEDGVEAYHKWPETKGNPFTSEKDILDNQVVIFEFANNVRATFHANAQAAHHERRVYIVGSEGSLRGDLYTNQYGYVDLARVGWDLPSRTYNTLRPGGHGGSDTYLVRQIIKCMLDPVQPESGLIEGMKSAITCFAIDKAVETGRVVDLAPMWEQAGIRI